MTPTPAEFALQPGSYDDGLLSIAVNDDVVTGFYENYTGWDEKTQAPRFSCLFLFAGRIENSKIEIASSDTKGIIELLENDRVKIRLGEEPGGCWNVEPRFIVNISSMAGVGYRAYDAPEYAASKAGVMRLTAALGFLKEEGVRQSHRVTNTGGSLVAKRAETWYNQVKCYCIKP